MIKDKTGKGIVDRGRWDRTLATNLDSTAIVIAKKPTEQMVLNGEEGEIQTYVGEEKQIPGASLICAAGDR